MEIDDIDFSVLTVAAQTEDPLWKKQIHRHIEENRDVLPLDREISVQTIGRHIDQLHEAGLLEPCIITPEEINRDLIIAYHSTDRGEAVLCERRDAILREFAAEAILSADGEAYSPATVAELAHRRFGVDRGVLDRMVERSERFLGAFLAYAYTKEVVEEVMTPADVDDFRETVQDHDTLREILSGTAFRREMRQLDAR